MKLPQQLLLLFIFISVTLFSQTETEVVGINYSYYSKSDYNFNTYNSSTQKINFFINYGHDFGKKSKLFYHVSYQDFNIETKTKQLNFPQDDIIFFPSIPDYSLVTLAIGIKNELKKTGI